LVGFVTPKGEFIECAPWEHLDKAQELCKDRYSQDFCNRQNAEDYLLSLGFLVIRARDAYMSYRNINKEPIMLTNEQLEWIGSNAENFNEGQKKDINEILHDQDLMRKRYTK
jgi:hypothetical protein